jgi:hypothetical protein
MRQFVAILQPVERQLDGTFTARPPLSFWGEIPAVDPFHVKQLPRDLMIEKYCEKYPEDAEVCRRFVAANDSGGGISHIVWDGTVKELLKQTPREQRANIKNLLRQAVRI